MKVKWIPIVTSEYGWDVSAERPAQPDQPTHDPKNVCLCDYCADNPHYGHVYCKRYGENNKRFYSDHQDRW